MPEPIRINLYEIIKENVKRRSWLGKMIIGSTIIGIGIGTVTGYIIYKKLKK